MFKLSYSKEVKQKIFKNISFYISLFLIYILANFLRLDLYFFNRSLWYDEAALYMSIKEPGFLHFFQNLPCWQSAPPLFLIETKILTLFFGISEHVLRFIPLFSALVAIPVFYYFAKIFLKKKISLIFACFLFAINTNLIYYSQEFKQYSFDVLALMLIVILTKEFKLKKPYLLGILLSIIMWYSFSSILASVAVWAVLLGYEVTKKHKLNNFLKFTMPLALNSLFFLIYLSFQTKNMEYLKFLWSNSYIKFNFSNFFDLLSENICYLFEPINFGLSQNFLLISIILIALCTIGAVFIYRQNQKNKFNFYLLLSPYFILLLFSYFKLYPYYDRLTLFLTPIFIVLAAKIFDKISKIKYLAAILTVLTAILLIKPVSDAQARMKNLPHQDRAIFIILKKYYKPQDVIITNTTSNQTFVYYSDLSGFKADDIRIETLYKYEADYLKYLMSLDKSKNYWFHTSNIFQNFETKSLIEFFAEGTKGYKHYNKRKSDLYYVQRRI